MGRKKNKRKEKKQKKDNLDDESVNNSSCNHGNIAKLANIKKGCKKIQNKKDAQWICITCGEITCGSTADEHSAIDHFKGKHHVAINLRTSASKCFVCKCAPTSNNKLDACVTHLDKKIKKFKFQTVKDDENDALHSNTEGDNSDASVSSNISTLKSKRKGEVNGLTPKGLTNLGNTCYFNSVMQNICETEPLRKEITIDTKKFPLREQLKKLMKSMNTKKTVLEAHPQKKEKKKHKYSS